MGARLPSAEAEQAGGPTWHHVAPTRPAQTLLDDLIEGFARTPRQLPPKHFYDARGSHLFDRICDTPEYYPTRVENALLQRHAAAIVEAVRPAHIVEFGSGTSRKTITLLDACERSGLAPAYWPFDVCAEVVRQATEELGHRFAWLPIHALVGDYTAGLDHLPRPGGCTLYMFLGGTLGNFEPADSRQLLGEIAGHMDAGDRLLLGADRVKDRATLEAAYDDSAGVTAEFNRNVLHVINRELGGDFDARAFAHRAEFNAARERIEIHLDALRPQTVSIAAAGRSYRFEAGEPIRTEISRKFTAQSLEAELQAAGLEPIQHYVDERLPYSLTLARSSEVDR